MNLIERRREMAGVIGEKPPTLIPYIRGGADGSYIDTGITPDATTRVIVWARNLNPYAYAWLFGSRVSATSNGFSVCAPNAANTGLIRLQFGNNSANTSDAFKYLGGYYKYELNGGALYVDDVKVASVTNSTFTNNHNIHLFGLNNNGSHASAAVVMDICACKIYKNGTLVRDYTAVNSPSVGLYDAVSDTVFTNEGTGSFTYGEFVKDAYSRLQHIYTSNAKFLTPIIGSYSLPIVVSFMATSTSAAWFDVLGGRDSTNRCQIFTGDNSRSNCCLAAIIGTGTALRMKNTTTAGETRNKKFVTVKQNNKFTTYYNNATYGNAVTYTGLSTTYSTGIRIGVGATNNNGSWNNQFIGNIYFVCFGASCNLVPAVVDNVTGMYDTYNDAFYSSATSTPFVAGPTI